MPRGTALSPLRRLAAAAAALAAAALAGPTAPAVAQERGGTPGVFDFYVLALSWSPTFCTLTGEQRGNPQCDAGKRLGFVVHGLWPQYDRGYPSECGAAPRSPSRIALEEAADVFPTGAGPPRVAPPRHLFGQGPGELLSRCPPRPRPR